MTQAFVGIGSNIEPARHVKAAVATLRANFEEVTCSTVYQTEAIGFEGPPFYNLVARFETAKTLEEVVARLHSIEARFGRIDSGLRYSSRTLDLDLLLFGDRVSREPIQLPHQDILEYAFVLKPLAELAPRLRHPVLRRTFTELWTTLGGTTVGELHPLALDLPSV